MDSSKSKRAQPEPETRKKLKTDYSGSEDTSDDSDDLPVGPELDVGVDELCLIFGNYGISAGDLLSFRMVNKNWRDAATTTLLKRNALCVNLNVDKDEDSSTSKQPGSRKLSLLTELISNSPKFPITKFNLHTSTKANVDYNNFPHLLRFFKLHGNKIRTLCLHGWITRKLLMDIVLNYTPSLVCLDLSNGKLWSSKEDGSDKRSGLKSKAEALPITSLWLGNTWKDDYYPGSDPTPTNDPKINSSSNAAARDILHWLLSSPSKLMCIENVNLYNLGGVLREGKGQSFTYFFSYAFRAFSSQILTRFLALKPNLSTVTLDMEYNESDKSSEPTADMTLVNAFISSFKDTVQDLQFYFKYEAHDWNSKVKLPPMKKLKSIAIYGNANDINTTRENGRLFDLHENFIQFEDGISAQNYFPSLKKISLFFNGYGGDIEEANLMSFFRFKSRRKDGFVWDSLPDVDTLETDWDVVGCLFDGKDTPEASLLSEMFPNIRILKIKCPDLFMNEALWWTICPKVEFMEIYGIENTRVGIEDEELSLSHFVDKMFTGVPFEICEKLKTTQLPDETNNPDMLEFLQVAPSIRRLQNLKELKLQFQKLFPTEFASVVTGVNAFLKMPNTKFIISCDLEIFGETTEPLLFAKPKNGIKLDDAEILEAEELCFGSIKPYVQIVHEKCTNY